MSYSAPNRLLMPMRHSIDTAVDGPLPSQASVGSTFTWPTANLAVYVPLIVPSRGVVVSLWYAAGASASGNIDLGVYDAGGSRIVSIGSTAKGSLNYETVFNITDTTLGPGLYYMALVSSTNSDTFGGITPTAPLATAVGMLTEGSALPLPATATFALTQTLAVYPLMGLFFSTVNS